MTNSLPWKDKPSINRRFMRKKHLWSLFHVNGIFQWATILMWMGFSIINQPLRYPHLWKPHGSFLMIGVSTQPESLVERWKKKTRPRKHCTRHTFFSYLKVHHHSQSPSSLSGPSGPHFVAPLVQILHPLSHCTQHQTSPGDRVHSRSTSRSDSCRVSEPPQPHTLMSGMKKMVTSFHPWCSYYIYIYLFMYLYIYIHIHIHIISSWQF